MSSVVRMTLSSGMAWAEYWCSSYQIGWKGTNMFTGIWRCVAWKPLNDQRETIRKISLRRTRVLLISLLFHRQIRIMSESTTRFNLFRLSSTTTRDLVANVNQSVPTTLIRDRSLQLNTTQRSKRNQPYLIVFLRNLQIISRAFMRLWDVGLVNPQYRRLIPQHHSLATELSYDLIWRL